MKHRKGKWLPHLPAPVNAKRELPLFAAGYFEAGRKLAARRPSSEKLHAFRLRTKHLRYTLEAFRPLYGPAMDGYISRLRKVQTVLGELNDYASTADLMMASAEADHADTGRLLEWLGVQEERKRKEFTHLWTEQFDAPGQQEKFATYLRRYARDPRSDV